MHQWYKDTKFKGSKVQGKLTVERVRTGKGWPKLKAKAAATRQLAPYALLLMQTFGGPEDRPILALCQLLNRFYELISHQSMFLSDDAKAEVSRLGPRLAMIYASLAEQAATGRVKMWKVNPKLHLFDHLCSWQAVEVGNPRFYWTYSDEDLVGLLIEVAESCHPVTMAASALFKWMHVYFE